MKIELDFKEIIIKFRVIDIVTDTFLKESNGKREKETEKIGFKNCDKR